MFSPSLRVLVPLSAKLPRFPEGAPHRHWIDTESMKNVVCCVESSVASNEIR